jgi:hypothetical protein
MFSIRNVLIKCEESEGGAATIGVKNTKSLAPQGFDPRTFGL